MPTHYLIIFLRMKMNKLKLFDHICNNVIATSLISISEILSLGFSSVQLPQFTAPIRGNKVLGQVASLAQYQTHDQKKTSKKSLLQKKKKREGYNFFFLNSSCRIQLKSII